MTVEWDGVVPSRGRGDGESGVSVTQVGGFKGHFYTSLCSTVASRGDCNGLLNMEVITVHLCVCVVGRRELGVDGHQTQDTPHTHLA